MIKRVVRRVKRSPETIRAMLLEAEKTGNASDICRREGIAPSQFYAWRAKARRGEFPAIKSEEMSPPLPFKLELDKLVNQLSIVTLELQQLKKRALGQPIGKLPTRIRRHTRTYRST